MSAVKPASAEEVAAAVAQAVADETPLEIVGHGSKRGLGRPVQAAQQLDLSALSGITQYEPAELVLTCRAGTPMAEIETALKAKNQQLAFEPADLAPLYGGTAGAGTIGGVLSCNLAGPRRISAGAARDHFLGFAAVSGRGEAFRAGGRVVKNVTGYDLCKLMAGAHGTLAVLTEVTVKVLPAPEKSRTVLLYGLADAAAIKAMIQAQGSAHEISAAAHLPAAAAARSAVDYVAKAGGAVTAIRVEGPGPSVEHRCAMLQRELADFGPTEELHSMRSAMLWREVRDVARLLPDPARAIWRLSVPPAHGADVISDITPPSRSGGGRGGGRAAGSTPEYYYDWAGGLVWLALPPAEDAAVAAIRAAVARHGGGHATLVRAPDALRLAVPVFEPQPEPLAALSARVKEGFDPRRILNPGRLRPDL
ncbi:MAG TPA: glycolate oxidase subunit GlcE [Methylomirabilota bacterium]|nr:glycolate oxidase subunit GlcE [Methylomirabilota bacterium]